MARDFHPGPELLPAPHRGRRYECSLSDPPPPLSLRSQQAPRSAELPTHPPFRGRGRVASFRLDRLALGKFGAPRATEFRPPPADGILWLLEPPRPSSCPPTTDTEARRKA